jgi:N-acetylmuramic acid 6-phosphate etherase
MERITESPSRYDHLERMGTGELLRNINAEDRTVAEAVEKVIPALGIFVDAIVERMQRGGRLFYMGAGTSGRWASWTPANARPPSACRTAWWSG